MVVEPAQRQASAEWHAGCYRTSRGLGDFSRKRRDAAAADHLAVASACPTSVVPSNQRQARPLFTRVGRVLHRQGEELLRLVRHIQPTGWHTMSLAGQSS